MSIKNESGIALLGTLLILVLLGALLSGFVLSVNSEQQMIGIDRGQTQSFYGALAGLEQLTASLDGLFARTYAPTGAQISALTLSPPTLPYMNFVSPGGGSGYQILVPSNSVTRMLTSGPYAGLQGEILPYSMIVTAHSIGGPEAKIRRDLQVIEVPIFQFGIFSQTDLSFFAGPDFSFGGRVHTNGNLFLAEGDGKTLTLSSRVTAVGEVIRTNLSNGHAASSSYTGTVNIATTEQGTNMRPLASDEGSLKGTLGTDLNDPKWSNLSLNTYHGNILNGRTGAHTMTLPIVSAGATPIGLIQRPEINENANAPAIYQQRRFYKATMRIVLSDSANEITSLPQVTGTAPVRLTSAGLGAGRYAAESPGWAADANFKSSAGTPLIDGFIKIEIQTDREVWQDVTAEILNLGISGPDLTGNCANPSPNAIIRLQRLKDSPTLPNCGGAATEFWPNTLYDAREGDLRANVSTTKYTAYLGGVMHYLEIDVNNLCRWFRGEIGTGTGVNANRDLAVGYEVYISDRRTNKNGAGEETGEYGFEDVVNSADSTNGTPDGVLETAEDVNGNSELDIYGRDPRLPVSPYTVQTPLDGTALPTTEVSAAIARRNRAIFFRRAVKLVNGATINLGNNSDGYPYGLTFAVENPVYIKGDYNTANSNFTGSHVGASILADAVTLLSNNWNDLYSFNCPHTTSSTCQSSPALPGRVASDTSYRVAIVAGKGRSFTKPSGRYQDFGTDGGVHNFLRFLENWGGKALNYRGSIISLFYNQQAVGTYKCGENSNVYQPPTRGYKFDSDFLTRQLLPPDTPVFRDINITGFTQLKMPNQ
jgi:hypothetical protein